MTISNQKLAKGWNIEVSASQFEYLCEVLMEANAMDVAEQKGWDIQTFDNLIDNVCNAKETYLSRDCKGVYPTKRG
ncbi:MAG: hypothetical protein CM15mV34_0120 [Caudoviricetes sp.]|nr:MAG: hypothetical protein CM15mV34_0120 [Caudoviricetes sp.]